MKGTVPGKKAEKGAGEEKEPLMLTLGSGAWTANPWKCDRGVCGVPSVLPNISKVDHKTE